MKVMPTLEGGLRIDTEDASDWDFLRSIVADANGCKTDLASRLGGLISEEAGGEDWKEYVVPDLREEFQDELAQVGAVIESAAFNADGGGGPLWISPDDVFAWYGSLNQAKLSLQEQYQFEPFRDIVIESMTPEQCAALIRFQFYDEIQYQLLKHVMR